jgi:hypothetical protein
MAEIAASIAGTELALRARTYMRSFHSILVAALLLSTAAGCAAGRTDAADGSADEALSASSALVVSPVADPDLKIAIQLARTSTPEHGPESVSVVLSRRGQSQTVPCDHISAGGNDGTAQRIWCELSQGRDENEVHERFVLSITRTPASSGDVYTLTDALHDFEGTDWVPLIDMLNPSWRTKPFRAEALRVLSHANPGGNDPFYFAESIEDLLVSASKGLMLPNSPSHIGTAPHTTPPSGAGPFAVSDASFALFGDYQPSFVFTIAPGVWWNLSGVSVFETPNDPASGLTAPATLRSRIEVAAGVSAPGGGTGALVAAIKTAYENAVKQSQSDLADIAPGEHDVDPSKLTGAAKEAYEEYLNCAKDGLRADVGGPVVKALELDGTTIYFVAGDVSDTGSEYGFYDSHGLVLAQAYTGQGMHPGEHGIDWML